VRMTAAWLRRHHLERAQRCMVHAPHTCTRPTSCAHAWRSNLGCVAREEAGLLHGGVPAPHHAHGAVAEQRRRAVTHCRPVAGLRRNALQSEGCRSGSAGATRRGDAAALSSPHHPHARAHTRAPAHALMPLFQ
jgi:hypothetical protein